MMKRFLIVAALLAASLTARPAMAVEQTVTFDVANMTCAVCPLTVKTAMQGVDGVVSAVVSGATNTAVVVYDDAKADANRIAQAATNAGYPATKKE